MPDSRLEAHQLHADLWPGLVLEARADGTGVIEIPIAGIDSEVFSLDDLRGMVANFRKTRGIIVGVTETPHVPDLMGRAGDQPAFVEALELRGSVLWGRIDIVSPELFAKRKSYRGFSVEARRGSGLPEAWKKYAFEGWVLVGGIFTNRQRLEDATFKIAADATAASAFTPLSEAAPLGETKESRMATTTEDKAVISLDAHNEKMGAVNAELANARDKVTRLESQAASMQTEIANLTTAKKELESQSVSLANEKALLQTGASRIETQNRQLVSTVSALEIERNELKLQLTEHNKATTDERIKAFCLECTTADPAKRQAALPPALLPEGWNGADPTGAVLAQYASVESFETHFRHLRGVAPRIVVSSVPQPSGHDPAKAADPNETQLSAEEQKVFDQHGWDTDFVGVNDEIEARRIHNARKAAQAK